MKIYDIIKWDPSDAEGEEILVYKHEAEDFNTHSQLIVHSSQEAILFKDGQDLDVFDAGRHTLSSNNLPGLRKIISIPSDGETPFHCEVYFINKIHLYDLKWGTSEAFIVEDPVEGVNVHIRASGYIGAHISDGRKFLRKVVGTRAVYSKQEFTDYLRTKIIEKVKSNLGQMLIDNKVGILSITTFISTLSDALKLQLAPYFEEFGIALDNFSFNTISPLEEDLRAVNEAKISAKKLDLESRARAKMREREGYTYQQEQSFDVLKTASKNEGMSGSILGAGMGLGLGFGIGGTMNQLASSIETSNTSGAVNQASTSKCSSCGVDLPTGAKFCSSCGAKVVDLTKVICPKCNSEFPVGTKFCSNCGEKLIHCCKKCGAELPAGTKFCKECGTPQ